MASQNDRTDRRGTTVTHADIESGIRRGRQLRSQAFRQFFANISPIGGRHG